MIHIPFTGNLAAQRRITTVHRIDVTEHGADPGADARVQLKDTDSNGVLLCDIRLAPKESRHIAFSPPLYFPAGVYLQVSAGTVRGSVTGE
ncbi:hypothetical protein PP509_gp31 [Gordonia phage MichaelScott]|uniref:Uncharacterized protein n=1 Tax=Gordonia phage MichaelScott TaxID=2759395 RepID=A0A7L7SIM9_9CAUD|nr:hypothetical protein PP509_gp31 [Gordonia phage MichaelScott]QOC56273.1 hypothetical protein SEA_MICHAELSCOTT_31 [Gordonia phage MichaelScott]